MEAQPNSNLSNFEVERAVIGAMLIDSEALSSAFEENITEMHFYDPVNAVIFNAIRSLYMEDSPVDQVTVAERLRKNKALQGGDTAIAGIISENMSAANIRYHIYILADKLLKRKIAGIAASIKNDAESANSGQETLERLENEIILIQEEKPKSNIISIRDCLHDTMIELSRMYRSAGLVTGVETGFGRLNYMSGGFRKGNLIIIGGRTGQGKSSLALTFSINASKAGYDVLYFSLEMTAIELTKRLISQESGFNIPSMHYRKPTDTEWKRLRTVSETTYKSENQIYIDETGGLTVWELSARAKRFRRDHNLGLVIVDYIQLAKGDKGGTREQEIASITRQLKALAKILEVPVIALAQVSRRVEETGKERRPVLSDLRESGAIENDADMVIFVYNPRIEQFEESHYQYILPADLEPEDLREMIVAKYRHGETGIIFTKWNSDSAMFESMEYDRRKP